MHNLEAARERIDGIDRQILDLLAERMQAAEDVASYKIERGLPVTDELRERAVVDSRTETARNLGLPEGAEELFQTIMRMSKLRQEELFEQNRREINAGGRTAAFQGIRGANSHVALIACLGDEIRSEAFDTFEGVFQAVSDGRALYGVLPIENSYAGSVLQVYDLLRRYDVYIVGEKSLRIDHKLVVVPGALLEDIRTVFSHEQALAQCAEFFTSRPEIELKPYYNTAAAARMVSEGGDRTVAALANSYAAQLYGLETLDEEVTTSRENTTRFIVIGRRPYGGADANKASVCFTLSHHPGTLAQALAHFASHSLNMVKIESRPIRDRNFEYAFYVDFEGKDVRSNLEGALREDETLFADIRMLGAYKK